MICLYGVETPLAIKYLEMIYLLRNIGILQYYLRRNVNIFGEYKDSASALSKDIDLENQYKFLGRSSCP
jgi:hypothetical protein